MNDVSLARRFRPFSRSFGSSLVKTGWGLSLALLIAAILLGPIARAAAPDDDDNPETPSSASGNGRAVRLSYLEGGVRVTQGDQVIADPAVVNMPLFEGTEVATAEDGRAEIQLEDGSIVRLSPNTTLDFTVMQLQGTVPRTEITLRGGLAYFEVQPSNAEHRLRIRYDDASFTASESSIVRLTHDASPAELAVLSGNIRVERASALQLDVHAGESLTLDANDLSRYNLASAVTQNSWDNWNADRDQALNAEAADQTTATENQPDYPSGGMSDLDANGNWYNVPGQGYVWSPYEAQDAGAGWDPYGYGNWIDYPQYGYVWVSGYRWGYSPFSCGLWDYYDDFGWAWAPGYGCNPWWGYGGGRGGWVYRIGNNRPPGYHPPHRPRPPLRGGGARPVGPEHNGWHRTPANPVVTVDRRPGGGGPVPVSRDGGQVTIAGHPVEPLRPIGRPRQGFRTSGSQDNAPGSPNSGFVITGRRPLPGNPTPGTSSRPVYMPPRQGVQPNRPQAPNMPRSEPARPIQARPVAPAPRYSPPPRMSTPPPPRMSAPPPPPPRASPPPAARPR
ncbi:MAG TPA: FecR domain-containing protein [Acidobacteriaceae bacterium]|nr:FecR domain-containing protein [Acidobacteriaceae bacterium]